MMVEKSDAALSESLVSIEDNQNDDTTNDAVWGQRLGSNDYVVTTTDKVRFYVPGTLLPYAR